MTTRAPLVSLNLSAGYPGKPDVLRSVQLEIYPGEILALAGESGSGKSTLGLALLGLLGLRGGSVRGSVQFDGLDLLTFRERQMRTLRGRRIGFVPQSPVASLNPCLTVGAHLEEAWRAHASAARWRPRALGTLEMVSLPTTDDFLRLLPSQLSVGIAQRLLIAMAVIHRPSLVIADEPTSALDVITQAAIRRLFAELNERMDVSILFISHDLPCIAALAHRVAILSAGEIVEAGPVAQVFRQPRDPYTRLLIEALPEWQGVKHLPQETQAFRR